MHAANATRYSIFKAKPVDVPASWSDTIQLYHPPSDPHERRNLVHDKAHQPTFQQLWRILRRAYPFVSAKAKR